jgi:hypothetical protein
MNVENKRKILNVDFSCVCIDAWVLEGKLFDEKRIKNLLDKALAAGFDAISWRTRFAGKATYWGKTIDPFNGFCDMRTIGMREVMKQIDPLSIAISHAHEIGLKIFSWVDPFDCYLAGVEDDFFVKNCEYLLRSKNGNILHTPCYNYPEVRARYIDEAREYMQYGLDGILYSLFNTHLMGYNSPSDVRGEYIYGYNEPIVDAYKDKHGIDILREKPDPELLARIQGEGITELLREIHSVVHEQNAELLVTTSMNNHLGGGIYPNAWVYNDWHTWVNDGIVDSLTFDHCMDPVQTMKDIANKIAPIKNANCSFGLWFCAWHDYATAEYSNKFQKNFISTQEMTDMIIHEAASFLYVNPVSVPQHPASNSSLWDMWNFPDSMLK